MKTTKLIICFILSMFFHVSNAQHDCTKCEVVYGCGVAISMEDNIACFTEIQQLPNAHLTKKENFLINRNYYSSQFEKYIFDDVKKKYICTIFFDTNKTKLQQQISKLKKKYSKKYEYRLVEVSQELFEFK